MKRDVASLRDNRFDLLVVGGGVYGAWTAYIAALSGIRTALIDRGDWACGTSSASSKLIHGGLRYLEQFRLGLVRSSLDERRVLARVAPQLVTPLRFVLPVYEGDRVGKLRLRAGLWLYDTIARGRQPVAPHRYLPPEKVGSVFPGLSRDGLAGAFTYGDCLTDDARFVLELVGGAVAAGAAASNYVEAEDLEVRSGSVTGAAAVDRQTGERFHIAARVVVNAAGPWAATALGESAAPGPVRLVKGVHLVMPALDSDHALLFFSRADRRVIFVIPWYGRTLLGTTDTEITGDASAARVERADVDYLLDAARRVLPGTGWDRSAVVGSFAGVRALGDRNGGVPESLSREWSLVCPRPGVLVSVGGKYTTARPDAERIVKRVTHELGVSRARLADTRARPFPRSPDVDTRPGLRDSVSPADRYHARAAGAASLESAGGGLDAPVVEGLPFLRAQVVYAATHEMAVTLEDILRRRIPLLLLAPPDRAVLEDAAALAAGPLGWTAERADREVEALIRKYTPVV